MRVGWLSDHWERGEIITSAYIVERKENIHEIRNSIAPGYREIPD
jgi:hypothetical protein